MRRNSIYKVSEVFVIIVAGDDDRLLNKSLFLFKYRILKLNISGLILSIVTY